MRLMRIAITRPAVMAFFRRFTENLPDDAECKGMNYNSDYDQIQLFIESQEFEEIPEGELVPFLELIVRRDVWEE